MCVKISLIAELGELQNLFNDYQFSQFEPIYKGNPLSKYPVLTANGIKNLQWGEKKDTLIIHHQKTDLETKKYKRGVLAITGFYIIKKEKTYAPVGFGDHKETIKIIPYLVKRKDDDLMMLPVLLKENSFYIIMQKSNTLLQKYQKKEPLIISKHEKWMSNSKIISKELKAFDYEISVSEF